MEEEKESERPRITLSTVIPELPSKQEKVPAPDEDKFERELKILDDRISRLRGERGAISQIIREKREGGRVEAKDTSAKQVLQGKTASNKELKDAKFKLIAQLRQCKDEFATMRDEQATARGNLQLRDADKVDQRIQELQTKVETTTITLKEEKLMIAEISRLQKSKPQLTEFNNRSLKMDHNKKGQEDIKQQLDKLNSQIQDMHTEIEEISKNMRLSRDKFKEELPKLIEDREAVEAKLKELETQKNQH